MKNIMIDIETLGTSSSSVILSIGAIAFNDHHIGDEFSVDINIDSCLDAGLKVDGRTIAWWMEQGVEARKLFAREGVPLAEALNALTCAFDWKDTLVWANGICFDMPILDTAYRAVRRQVPWSYFNVCDYRTLKNDMGKDAFKEIRVEPTIAHNALEDARAQALTLMALQARRVYPAVA